MFFSSINSVMDRKLTYETEKSLRDEIDYIGDNLSLFSHRPCVRIVNKPSVLKKCSKISCDIDGMVEFITNGSDKKRFLMNGACNDEIKIELIKKNGVMYLSDGGTLATYVNKYGNVTFEEYGDMLMEISSDYDLLLENHVLLSEVSEYDFIDCYRNMNNVIAKIRLLTGTLGGVL